MYRQNFACFCARTFWFSHAERCCACAYDSLSFLQAASAFPVLSNDQDETVRLFGLVRGVIRTICLIQQNSLTVPTLILIQTFNSDYKAYFGMRSCDSKILNYGLG